jgi:hypothetical protein
LRWTHNCRYRNHAASIPQRQARVRLNHVQPTSTGDDISVGFGGDRNLGFGIGCALHI